MSPKTDRRIQIFLSGTALISFPPIVDATVGAIRDFRYSYSLDHELRWDVLTIDTKDDLFYFGCALALFFAYRTTVARSASGRRRLWALALGAGSFFLVGVFSCVAVADEWGQGILEGPTSFWGWYLFLCHLVIPMLIGCGILLVGWRTGRSDVTFDVIPDGAPKMVHDFSSAPGAPDAEATRGTQVEP